MKTLLHAILLLVTTPMGMQTDTSDLSENPSDFLLSIEYNPCLEQVDSVSICEPAIGLELRYDPLPVGSEEFKVSYVIDLFDDNRGRFGQYDLYAGELSQGAYNSGQRLINHPASCDIHIKTGFCNEYADDRLPFNANGVYPLGRHEIIWTVISITGEIKKDSLVFEVKDCLPPQLTLVQGVVTKTMPVRGEICFETQDFVAAAFDNCTATEDLKFYFNNKPELTQYCIVCDTFEARGAGDMVLIDLRIYAADESHNYDFGVSALQIIDDKNVCTSEPYFPTGRIETLWHESMPGVSIEFRGPDWSKSTLSGPVGSFTLYEPFIRIQDSIVVKPSKDGNWLEGVSTSDLFYILRHLQGKGTFDAAFQYIAGDVNNDHRISIGDVMTLFKLITGRVKDLEKWGQNSFVFTPANDAISSDTILYDLPDHLILNFDNAWKLDFIGIKIGDLNGDYYPSDLHDSYNRTTKAKELTYRIVDSHEGHAAIEFLVSEDIDLSGLQLKLKYDHELMSWNGFGNDDALSFLDVGVNHNDDAGEITMVWIDMNAESTFIKSGTTLFTLQFDINDETFVQDRMILELVGDFQNMAYDRDLEPFQIELNSSGQQSDEGQTQVSFLPNPFNQTTSLTIMSTKHQHGVLDIYSLDGHLLTNVTIPLETGKNSIDLDTDIFLPEGHVFFYRVRIGQDVFTGKLIKQ